MDDLAALVAAIDAHPDDDHVRLVAADWLDEHSEPEPCPGQCRDVGKGYRCVYESGGPDSRWVRCPTCSGRGSIDRRAAWAELIRCQVELANTADPHGDRFWDGQLGDGPKCYQRRKALRARERAALPLAAPLLGVTPDGKLLDAGPCPVCDAYGENIVSGVRCVPCSGSGRRRVPCVVERGFPVALLTLREAVGEVCRRCDGDGGCSRCGAPPEGPPRLTGAVPLPPAVGVRVTDREPEASGQHTGWVRWYAGDHSGEIPRDVYALLVGEYPESRHGRSVQPYWRTPADALSALHAAVREIRHNRKDQ